MVRADFLDEKRKEIDARVKELRPLVEEYRRLEAAAAALDGVLEAHPRRRARGRATGARARGAPRRDGTRGAQAIAIVRESPGLTVRELAARMGIGESYLYRVLPRLEREGHLVRDAGRWSATQT